MPLTDTNPSIGAKNYWAAAAGWPWWQQWLFATGITLVLYIPILGNTFVNDDWLVLKRLVLEERLNTRGFFRPLSDITIWLNYQIGGLNAFNYYLFGIILRGLSVVLLYRLCLRWHWDDDGNRRYMFAGVAALIFITYPFHNEPVAWILGRGALMAGILSIAALLFATSKLKDAWKIMGICVCYFVGLLAYESILLLPAMVLVYMFATNRSYSRVGVYVFFIAMTLALHILLRTKVSGTLVGAYGEGFVGKGKAGLFIINVLKAMVRNIVPPQPDSDKFLVLAGLLVVCWLVVKWQLRKRFKPGGESKTLFFSIVGFWLFSLFLPGFGGVSTRTSESDRFLELPSYFLCMITAFFMIALLQRQKTLLVWLFVILACNIFFLERNNANWAKASDIVRQTIQLAKSNGPGSKLYLYQLPEQVQGAYVFRVGFKDALLLNGIDTAMVQVHDDEIRQRLPTDRDYYWNGERWREFR